AELVNGHGRALLRVRLEPGQRPGSLFAPMHWSDQFAARGRIDALVPAHVDPHSGQPELKHAAVALRRFDVRWQGVLLSELPLALPRSDYWAALPVAGGWLYWLAGAGELADARRQLLALLPGEPELLFDDGARRGLRCAWLE